MENEGIWLVYGINCYLHCYVCRKMDDVVEDAIGNMVSYHGESCWGYDGVESVCCSVPRFIIGHFF